MQLPMSFARSLAMPASFLGSVRASVSLLFHFMHADGVRDNIRHVTSLVYLAQKHESLTEVESAET